MANPWLTHLAAYCKVHPSMSRKDAMKAAAKTYKKKDGKK